MRALILELQHLPRARVSHHELVHLVHSVLPSGPHLHAWQCYTFSGPSQQTSACHTITGISMIETGNLRIGASLYSSLGKTTHTAQPKCNAKPTQAKISALGNPSDAGASQCHYAAVHTSPDVAGLQGPGAAGYGTSLVSQPLCSAPVLVVITHTTHTITSKRWHQQHHY